MKPSVAHLIQNSISANSPCSLGVRKRLPRGRFFVGAGFRVRRVFLCRPFIGGFSFKRNLKVFFCCTRETGQAPSLSGGGEFGSNRKQQASYARPSDRGGATVPFLTYRALLATEPGESEPRHLFDRRSRAESSQGLYCGCYQ